MRLTRDTTRDDAEVQIPVPAPKEQVRGRTQFRRSSLQASGYTGPLRIVCDTMFLRSRVHLVNFGLNMFSIVD